MILESQRAGEASALGRACPARKDKIRYQTKHKDIVQLDTERIWIDRHSAQSERELSGC